MVDFILCYWQVGLYAFLLYLVGIIGKKLKEEICKQKAIEEGIKAVLHDKLYEKGTVYIEQGYISLADLNNIEIIYRSYVGLKGNHTGTKIYNDILKLKIVG